MSVYLDYVTRSSGVSAADLKVIGDAPPNAWVTGIKKGHKARKVIEERM